MTNRLAYETLRIKFRIDVHGVGFRRYYRQKPSVIFCGILTIKETVMYICKMNLHGGRPLFILPCYSFKTTDLLSFFISYAALCAISWSFLFFLYRNQHQCDISGTTSLTVLIYSSKSKCSLPSCAVLPVLSSACRQGIVPAPLWRFGKAGKDTKPYTSSDCLRTTHSSLPFLKYIRI